GVIRAGGDKAAAGDLEIARVFLRQDRPDHAFEIDAGGEGVQPDAVGDARGHAQHVRSDRGELDRRDAEAGPWRRELRRHQREIVEFATVLELLAVFPAGEYGAQGLGVFAHAGG